MFYLIEESKEGRLRLIRSSRTKTQMEMAQQEMACHRTTSVHKFKNSTEVMAFIKERNGDPQPGLRFTSVPMELAN